MCGYVRNSLLVLLATMIVSCAHKPVSEAVKQPDSQVAFIAWMQSKGIVFNSREFYVNYIDGVSIDLQKEDSYVFGGYKLLPGKHTLGILVQHGNICIPSPAGNACFNSCFSGMAVQLEAGRRYGYDIEKNLNEVVVNVIDDTGKVISQSLCEPCGFVCGGEKRQSIMERFQQKFQEQGQSSSQN